MECFIVALFFYMLGWLLVLLFWRRKRLRYLFLASIGYLIALYTYHTYRIHVPLTWAVLLAFFFKQLPKMRKGIVLITLILLLLSLPILFFSFTANGNARFASTSTFSEYPAGSIQQKIVTYPMVFLKNYLSFFSSEFLFILGDGNGRHQVPREGLLFKWQLPFLLIGVYWLLRQKRSYFKYVILLLLLLAPVAGSIARPSPHTLRPLLQVIPMITVITLGILAAYEYIKKTSRALLMASVIIIFLVEYTLYLQAYYIRYPNMNALDWGASYKETVQKTENYRTHYKHIIVDENIAFAYTYFEFYAPELHPLFVGTHWHKPPSWPAGSVLYIRPFYGNRHEKQVIDQVYLPGPDKTIFAQFYKL